MNYLMENLIEYLMKYRKESPWILHGSSMESMEFMN